MATLKKCALPQLSSKFCSKVWDASTMECRWHHFQSANVANPRDVLKNDGRNGYARLAQGELQNSIYTKNGATECFPSCLTQHSATHIANTRRCARYVESTPWVIVTSC